jgi:hypothetical protein
MPGYNITHMHIFYANKLMHLATFLQSLPLVARPRMRHASGTTTARPEREVSFKHLMELAL